MFDDYQGRTTETFKPHKELSADQARLLDWALGLGGESGEVLELLKHHIYSNEELNKMDLVKELGDILWYLTAIAETIDVQLSDVAKLNMAKLEHRYHKGEYSDSASQERHFRELEFIDTPIYKIIKSRVMNISAPMNVMFVGPDGSGKTTLAKQVAHEMNFKYHKCNYQQKDKPVLAQELLNSQINIVYDRFYWPDDIIYAHIKKLSYSKQYWNEYTQVIKLLEDRNTLFIYVNCSLDQLTKRSKQWKDDYITTDMLYDIERAYAAWLQDISRKDLRLATFEIDTTDIEVDSAQFALLVRGCCEAIKSGQEVYAGRQD